MHPDGCLCGIQLIPSTTNNNLVCIPLFHVCHCVCFVSRRLGSLERAAEERAADERAAEERPAEKRAEEERAAEERAAGQQRSTCADARAAEEHVC